jgi:OHCU decarboxylase
MVARRPITSVYALSEAADSAWGAMLESDWLQAFACHPRIGDRKPAPIPSQEVAAHSTQSEEWSRQEQSLARAANERVLAKLAEDNQLYEQRFGFTYIVCATGKSAAEMLAILKQRLSNDREVELREAAEQQRQIMQIRLGKWLAE